MKKSLVVILSYLISVQVHSQHEHHMPPASKDTVPVNKAKPTKDTMHFHSHSQRMSDDMGMPSHSYSLSLPMSRNASGTAWNPDASPMYMWLKESNKTSWMFHGNIFLRYTHSNVFNAGKRGEGEWSFPNWFMAMMNHKTGKRGLLNLTAMISLDRLTDGGSGYPLLFQSGETWQGQRLVDKQHPHDLFSALSVGYTHMLNKNMDIYGYFGYPGEPALGAPAFMHRISSMNNPDAPLGHHWQDATHITFGVATLGFRFNKLKIEGSIFTGQEPDENRFDFDNATFDSYSYRLSYNPSKKWALQFSQGFIHQPEPLEPGIDVRRTTASALFTSNNSKANHFSGAAIWGLNDKGEEHKEHSLLLEGNYQFNKNAIFSRYEFIQKSAEEIDLENELGHTIEAIHAVSIGYNRVVWNKASIDFIAGLKATTNFPSNALNTYYGNTPVGVQLYFQIRPGIHRH